MRLVSALQSLNVSYVMQILKKSRIKSISEAQNKDPDPIQSLDKYEDKLKIIQILLLGYFLSIMKLAFIIMNVCYFTGMGWYIFCVFE